MNDFGAAYFSVPAYGDSATSGQRPIVSAMKRAVLRLGSLALLGLGLYGIWTVFRSGQVIAFVLVIVTAVVVIWAGSKISEKRAERREGSGDESHPWWDS